MTISPQFLIGGRAKFTVDNGRGEHFTFRINRPNDTTPFFASVMRGPDNENSFSYAGVYMPPRETPATVRDFPQVRRTAKSKLTDEAKSMKVLRWALRVVHGLTPLPDGYNIRHEGKCSCCGRTLTEPESLECGIGPICRGRMGL